MFMLDYVIYTTVFVGLKSQAGYKSACVKG